MKTAPRLEGREGLGTEEGKAGSGILWEFLAGRAPEVSSAFLPCLPGDLSGSSQPRSVRSWPPPHTQGQQEPPQAFLAAANGGTRGAFQLLVSDREWWVRCMHTSSRGASVWASGHGACLGPRCGGPCVSPLAPSLPLYRADSSLFLYWGSSCSDQREVWASWGEAELSEGASAGPVQRR